MQIELINKENTVSRNMLPESILSGGTDHNFPRVSDCNLMFDKCVQFGKEMCNIPRL